MWLFFALVSSGLLLAVFFDASMSWDGSYYFFYILEFQTAYTPHDRIANWLLHEPLLLATHLTHDLRILAVLFGGIYATIPLFALILSWWMVHDSRRTLFIWAAIGIGLIMIPSQFFFVAEINIALQLFWPIVLGIITGAKGLRFAAIIALSSVLLFLHPLVLALFATAIGMSIVLLVVTPAVRTTAAAWMFWFEGLLVIGALRFSQLQTEYESEQLGFHTIKWALSRSGTGIVLAVSCCALFIAGLIFTTPLFRRRLPSTLVFTSAIEVLCFIVVGGLLIYWAHEPQYWREPNFRFLLIILMVPFVGLAFVESTALQRQLIHHDDAEWRHRQHAMALTGIVFSLTLGMQSVSWSGLSNRLADTLQKSEYHCVPFSSIEWLHKTPLDFWATSSYSLYLQGNKPEYIVTEASNCTADTLNKGIYITENDFRLWSGQWYELEKLGQLLVAERDYPQKCWYAFGEGWYETEWHDNSWWRWSDGTHAEFVVASEEPIETEFSALVQSYTVPNRISIYLNGESVGTINVEWEDLRLVDAIPLALSLGQNTITLVSQQKAVKPEDDPRPLALAVSEVNLFGLKNDVHYCTFR